VNFDKEYWDKNYSDPHSMDGIGNAKDHVKYLKSFFDLELIDVSSIVDLGFGYGHLFQSMMKTFIPYKAMGIEPSQYAFNKATKRKLKPVDSTKLELFNESVMDWVKRKDSKKLRFDLAICTSVLQYLSKEEIIALVSCLSKRVKYLYLTVPTDIELDRQIDELEFNDTYAKRRSAKFYRKILSEHFTNISSKIWESKFYFNEKTTLFTDLLYRS
jgi:trans-aconitate methyltransferase